METARFSNPWLSTFEHHFAVQSYSRRSCKHFVMIEKTTMVFRAKSHPETSWKDKMCREITPGKGSIMKIEQHIFSNFGRVWNLLKNKKDPVVHSKQLCIIEFLYLDICWNICVVEQCYSKHTCLALQIDRNWSLLSMREDFVRIIYAAFKNGRSLYAVIL